MLTKYQKLLVHNIKATVSRFDVKNSRTYNQRELWENLNYSVNKTNSLHKDILIRPIIIEIGDEGMYVCHNETNSNIVLNTLISILKTFNIDIWTVTLNGQITISDLYKKHNNVRENSLFVFSFLFLNNRKRNFDKWFEYHSELDLNNYLSIIKQTHKTDTF